MDSLDAGTHVAPKINGGRGGFGGEGNVRKRGTGSFGVNVEDGKKRR